MNVKTRGLFQPAFDLRVFVLCIVVHAQMEFVFRKRLLIDELQKSNPPLIHARVRGVF